MKTFLVSLMGVLTLSALSLQGTVVTQVTNNTEWTSASTWSSAAVPSVGNDYVTDGSLNGGSEVTLRSPFGGSTFAGGSLSVESNTRLLTKGNVSTFVINDLILNGGKLHHGDNAFHTLQGSINVIADSTVHVGGSQDTKKYFLESNLSGSSNLTLQGGGGTVSFAGTSNSYSGTVFVTNSVRVDFSSDYSDASFDFASGTDLVLDGDYNIASLTIGGASLSAGAYSFASLNSSYDAFFVDGGTGSLTVGAVPEPAHYALFIATM